MVAFYERRAHALDTYEVVNLSFYAHIHNHVEIVSVIDGEIDLNIGEHQKVLLPGELAIVFPNTVHSYHSEIPSYSRLLIFNTELVSDFSLKLSAFQPVSPFLSSDCIHHDVKSAFGTIAAGSGYDPGLVKGYLLVMLGRMLESLALERRVASSNESILNQLLSYIDGHYRQALTLDVVAEALDVSRFQISRCFAQRIGCSFNTYINSLRTSYAAELLSTTNIPVMEAGYDAGFESPSTFYRAFGTYYGTSPKAYRSNLFEKRMIKTNSGNTGFTATREFCFWEKTEVQDLQPSSK